MTGHPEHHLSEDEIRTLCLSLDTTSRFGTDEVLQQLGELGPRVVPHVADAYHHLRKWRGRVACVFHLIKYARTHDEAFQTGLTALEDPATVVRYRACMLLAKAQRAEAMPYLERLLDHADTKTAEDAAAAIDAIRSRNPNYFVDRMHTGRMFWSDAGLPDELKPALQPVARPWWKFWGGAE